MTYGKFASAEELLKGYNQLEKSFTQKCQQLAALKAAVLAEGGTNDTKDGAKCAEIGTNDTVCVAKDSPETSIGTTANVSSAKPIATECTAESHSIATVETDASATANESSSVALAESADMQNQTVAETQQELPIEKIENSNIETTSATVQSSQVHAVDTPPDGTNADDTNAPKILAAETHVDDTNADCAHVNDTQKPKTLASARDAATKLFESNNTLLTPDGTSVETPPSSAEQSTTVDSADTVPQSEFGAPVLDGHATAFSPTESQLQQYLLQNPKIAWQLLQQTSQPPQIMTGGGNVSLALPSRPKTIKEASLMAKQLFKN